MKTRKQGFTLIELLVVIAVIAVLMAILMPALKKAKEQAQWVACQANLKGFSLATSMYAQDNKEKYLHSNKVYFDTQDRLPGETISGPWGSPHHTRWYNRQVNLKYRPELGSVFFGYLADVDSLICPTFRKLALSKGVRVSDDVNWWGNEHDEFYDPWHNYTMNAYLGAGDNKVAAKRTQVKNPSEVFVFADEGPYSVQGINTTGLNDTSLWVIMPTTEAKQVVKRFGKHNVKPGTSTKYGQSFVDIIAGFHNAPSGDVTSGKGNCTFADGHVAAVKRDDSFTVSWPD